MISGTLRKIAVFMFHFSSSFFSSSDKEIFERGCAAMHADMEIVCGF
jgi:hypothetical protein